MLTSVRSTTGHVCKCRTGHLPLQIITSIAQVFMVTMIHVMMHIAENCGFCSHDHKQCSHVVREAVCTSSCNLSCFHYRPVPIERSAAVYAAVFSTGQEVQDEYQVVEGCVVQGTPYAATACRDHWMHARLSCQMHRQHFKRMLQRGLLRRTHNSMNRTRLLLVLSSLVLHCNRV